MSKTNLDYWREICLSKISSSEETPFGPEALVYKVGGKMFALIGVNAPLSMNLKCDPQEAMIIRESFEAVIPGYHMNKKHWNTVDLEADLDKELIKGWIDDSYDLVVKSLPKKVQAALTNYDRD
jgi:predicted DNA-binding protein (MmcQ/YjbR family)